MVKCIILILVLKDRQEYSEKSRLIIGLDSYSRQIFILFLRIFLHFLIFQFDLQTVGYYGYMYYLTFGT